MKFLLSLVCALSLLQQTEAAAYAANNILTVATYAATTARGSVLDGTKTLTILITSGSTTTAEKGFTVIFNADAFGSSFTVDKAKVAVTHTAGGAAATVAATNMWVGTGTNAKGIVIDIGSTALVTGKIVTIVVSGFLTPVADLKSCKTLVNVIGHTAQPTGAGSTADLTCLAANALGCNATAAVAGMCAKCAKTDNSTKAAALGCICDAANASGADAKLCADDKVKCNIPTTGTKKPICNTIATTTAGTHGVTVAFWCVFATLLSRVALAKF